MNGIMRYVPAESMIYYAFQTSCAAILLFVDFKDKEFICFFQIGLGPSKLLWRQWFFVSHPMPPNSVNRPDTQFHIVCYGSRADVIGF